MEIWDQKASVFTSLWDETTLSPVSYVWAMQNVFDFTEDDIERILKQQFLEGKMKLEIERVSGTDPMTAIEGAATFGGEPEFESQFDDDTKKPEPKPESEEKQEKKDAIDKTKDKAKAKEKVKEVDEHIENILATVRTIRRKKVNHNNTLINNSMSYENTLKMLKMLDENMESGHKKLNEIQIDKGK